MAYSTGRIARFAGSGAAPIATWPSENDPRDGRAPAAARYAAQRQRGAHAEGDREAHEVETATDEAGQQEPRPADDDVDGELQ